VLALLAVRGIGERDEWFTMHSLGDTVLVADNEIYAGLQSEVALLGYDVGSTVLRPGGQIPVTLYWKAIEPPTDNYRVFVHLIRPDGGLYGQSDKLNPAGFPTSRWPLDEYVRDEHELLITDTLPPGEYRLSVGLWNATTGQRLLAYDRSGEMLGDNVELPMLLQTR